ncbi:MAG: tryptophan 7-halogenase [Verrucomicrobiales bacterium]|nr:tryptophan 7-halogenase [Verrucomicrobiales bacterium]
MDGNPEVLIIGCGPGGSTAATFLAKAGRRVLVLEKETFPRFHVGESLLPYNRPLFEEMGVWPALAAAGFQRKFGAQFHLTNASKWTRFTFRNGPFTRHTEAIQVERARFDHLLMQHARQVGAEVREGWQVTRFDTGADGVRVEARDPGGATRQLRASLLIDASGRANLTGTQRKLRRVHPNHRKVAVYGHFTGVHLAVDESRGDTFIARGEDHWFWMIPVSSEKTSVGLVLDTRKVGRDREAAEVFRQHVAASRLMRERLAEARVAGEIKTTSDFSYFNDRLAEPRVLRVGDAAGFMDPIFSAGVFLAMWSGKLAALASLETLAQGGAGDRIFARYERRVQRAMRVYWRMVEHYYTTPFMELFLEPRHGLQVPAAVVAVLAGELEPPWHVRWRLEVFYLLLRIQKRRPLVPRLSFAEMEDTP